MRFPSREGLMGSVPETRDDESAELFPLGTPTSKSKKEINKKTGLRCDGWCKKHTAWRVTVGELKNL